VPAQPVPEPSPESPARRRPSRRFGSALVFAVLFFAGASFTAIAGDQTVQLLAEDAAELSATVPTGEPAAEEPAAEEPAVEEPVAEEPAAEEPAVEEMPAAEETPVAEETPAAEEAPAEETAEDLVAAPARFAPASKAPARASQPRTKARKATSVVRPTPVEPVRPLDPEADEPGATVWLHGTLPDLTPSFRLTRKAAHNVVRAARRSGLDWAFVLAVVRANGRGNVRQAAPELARLRNEQDRWSAALSYTGRTAAADRAVALAHYFKAVGLRTIVKGLAPRKQALTRRLLKDERVDIYPGGREDLEAGRIDVRVVALISYLAETYGQVTVSSLFSGHRLYARPGVVSAHIYGEAVDIASLGGASVVGHQQIGGIVEDAVRDILLLPAEVRPRQVISLLGLGGPSFPLADHGDHIHVGF